MTSKLYRKRTALDVNSEIFAAALMHHGLCSHAPHEHEVIEGQTFVDGKWVNRSLVAGMWTPCFARHSGVSTFVTDFEEGCAESPVFLETNYQALTCACVGCYNLGASWCPTCRTGWCGECRDRHSCFPHDEVTAVSEPWAHAALTAEEGDRAEAWSEHGVVPEDMKTELAVRHLFKRLQQEEEERKGDFSGIGSRYGYCHFVGPSLRVNKAIRNQVAKLHSTLGHPSNERMARMLKLQGAKSDVVQAARDLRCEVCSRIHPTVSATKSSATTPERFNKHCSLDSFFVLDADGVRWNVTHVVDGFCSLQYAVLSNPRIPQHRLVAVFCSIAGSSFTDLQKRSR